MAHSLTHFGDYDFILRSNISSFWRWDEYLDMLNLFTQNHGKQNLIIGHVLHPDNNTYFLSGCGYTISKNVAQMVLSEKDELLHLGQSCYDDVAMGYMLFSYDLIAIHVPYEHCETDDDVDKVLHHHIRVYSVAGDSRTDDLHRYHQLIQKFD